MIFIAVTIVLFSSLGDGSDPDIICGNTESLTTPYVCKWYISNGAINFHPKLDESKKRIDREINRVFGILPSWKEPATFSDWRAELKTWDSDIGIGRDLSPRITLMLWISGSKGVVKNKETYGLLQTDIRFTRKAIFITPELSWYPKDKVDYERVADKRGGDWIRAVLSGAKPYLAVASGYGWVHAGGSLKLKLPLLGTILHQKDRYDHHLFSFSPRLGVEVPLGKKSSFTVTAFYNFYDKHEHEYSGPCISFNYRMHF
ncbi:MAG: hypothetical protein KAH38_00410 [Candidatus Hydrogenedentes bacterium]|nr:hypothetical protein [Candidatus Hydrogenedentota bacterium]